MKVVAIIQARMGSSRLPGKVMQEIAGRPMLSLVIERVQRATKIDQIVIATTVEAKDDPIVTLCEQSNTACFRGSEDDVLDRYMGAARAYDADLIVRITSDCPLIEPIVIDQLVNEFQTAEPMRDYGANFIERTYPRGLDAEIMTRSALETAHREANQAYQRSHVTPYIYQNRDQFTLLSVTNGTDYSQWRWTVDTPEDLAFVREVYTRLGDDPAVDWLTVLDLMDTHPELAATNQHIKQKALHEG